MRVIILTNDIDSEGDKFDLNGMKLSGKVHVSKDFNLNLESYFGVAENISVEGNEVKADILVPENLPKELKGKFWPSIGFRMHEWEQGQGTRLIKSFTIYQVGLSDKPNVNPHVPPIEI